MAGRRRGIKLLGGFVLSLAGMVLLLMVFHKSLLSKVGGAFTQQPEAMQEGLSAGARALVDRSFEGIDSARLLDYHTHIVGLGTDQTGCAVNPHMLSWKHPVARVKFLVYASACGIDDFSRADSQFSDRLVSTRSTTTIPCFSISSPNEPSSSQAVATGFPRRCS